MSNKQIKLNSVNKFVARITKIMALFAFVACLFLFFIFEITYMSSNGFFSYDLLSFEHIWIFVFIFLQTCLFAIFYFPLNVALYNHRRKNYFVAMVFFVFFALIVCAIVLATIDNMIKDLGWTYFCLSIGFVFFLAIESLMRFYDDKNLQKLYSFLFIILLIGVCIVFIKLDAFSVGFKKLLINKSLAADKVEIYLKDKNQFVIGKMVFRDSKFAYVIYDDINSSNNGTDSKGQYRANKLVPIENVTILNPLPQDSTLQK